MHRVAGHGLVSQVGVFSPSGMVLGCEASGRNELGGWSLSKKVTFFPAVTKTPNRGNIREKGSILAHSLRELSPSW